jgi:hypothetical protein
VLIMEPSEQPDTAKGNTMAQDQKISVEGNVIPISAKTRSFLNRMYVGFLNGLSSFLDGTVKAFGHID